MIGPPRYRHGGARPRAERGLSAALALAALALGGGVAGAGLGQTGVGPAVEHGSAGGAVGAGGGAAGAAGPAASAGNAGGGGGALERAAPSLASGAIGGAGGSVSRERGATSSSAAGAGGAAGEGGAPADAGSAGAPGPVAPPLSPAPPEVPFRVTVLERGTRRALEGAAVVVDARPVGETEVDGSLSLSLPVGSHQIEAQFPGHASSREAVELVAGRGYEITVRLDTAAEGERYETEVRSHHKEVASYSLDARDARQIAGTSGDPIRVLASLPGVTQAVWPAAIFVVRGSNPGNTGFFFDGIRVPALFHIALGPSIVAPDLLGGMDFYPGAYPANYGRYIAGVVAVRSARPPEDRLHLHVNLAFYEASAVATSPVNDGRGVVAAAFRYSYTKPIVSLFDKNTTIDYRDYQLRFDHALGGGQFTIFAFGSFDQLDWTTRSVQSPGASTTQTGALQFHRLDFRWSGAVLGGRLLVGVTGEYDHAQSTLAQAPITVGAVGVAPRLMWSRRLGRSFELEAGADAEYQHFEAHPLPFAGNSSDLGRSRPALTQGTFASVRFQPNDQLVVSPGVRGDLFAEEGTSRYVVGPRLDARLDLKPWLGLSLNLGRFAQMPSLPISVAGFESFGLRSIGLQRSDGISGGVNARTRDDTTFEVTGFYQRMRVTDVSDLDLQSGKITGNDYLVLHDGVGYGVQTMIRRPSRHRFSGWVSYTLAYAWRNGTNGIVRSDWDQRHVMNLVAMYRAPSAFTFSATFHYNTGRELAVPPTIRRLQAPDFYRIDLRVERKFVFDRFILTAFIDVGNVTFQRDLFQYVATTGGPVPSYMRLVLPTIGVNGAF